MKRQISIVHMTSSHEFDDVRIFTKECRTLASQGYDVCLVAPNVHDGSKDGVRLKGVKRDNCNRLILMIQMAYRLYSTLKVMDAEVYHFHDAELITIGLFLRLKKKKVIYDVHEDKPRQILTNDSLHKNIRWIVSRLFEVFENYVARKMTMIVAATPFIRDRFLSAGCRAEDVNNYSITGELQSEKQVDWEKKERALCYIGAIWSKRGIFEMIKAIDKTDAKILLAGQFSIHTEYEKSKTMNGWKKVEYAGFVNRPQVGEILNRSMAGLLPFHPAPNHVNAQPTKLFEYMSAGIPVIASGFPLWKEIVEGNECGICIDPLNPNELSKAIEWIVSNPAEAKRMGENGRKAIEEKYNWKRESEKLLRIYTEILK